MMTKTSTYTRHGSNQPIQRPTVRCATAPKQPRKQPVALSVAISAAC